MKVEIENYRGWTISFDTEKETFYCHSEQYNRDAKKQSFASTKKFIDDFIKDNEVFKPVWIEWRKPSSFASEEKILLIGLRKDGRFIYSNAKGDKKQLSDYEEDKYILYDEKNEVYKKDAQEIKCEIDILEAKRKEVLSKITGVELTEYKKALLGEIKTV